MRKNVIYFIRILTLINSFIMKSTPVICGIDLGSWTFKLCVFNGEHFQILTNQANFRETPSLVGYTATERLIGEPALIKLKSNFNNTIRAPQRLLGLSSNIHLLSEELKYSKIKYTTKEQLIFSVEGKKEMIDVRPEQILVSLLGKAKSIIESHNLALSIAYMSVPTYICQEQRQSIIKCAELAFAKPVRLIDDWAALSSQYAYNRLKQLKSLDEMKNVVFMDIGYSKISLQLVQFTRFEGRLLDWEYLPYSGSKNMDHFISEFYDELFEKKHGSSIIKHPKAYVKLLDAVQRQRTVLSANNQYHLNLEYILSEQDLTYNMTREEFQNIIVPVLADIAASIAAIQSRNCVIPIHAVELMGGASRIPCVQSIISKIFGMDPSRSLNQSESIAVGSTIFGAIERKIINMPYSFDLLSTKQIAVRWGKERKDIFSKKSKINSEFSLNIGNQGIIEMIIFIEQGVTERVIGKLKFKTPNKVTFTLNQNKIIHARLSLHQFELYDLKQKSQGFWKDIVNSQQEMSKMDMRMGMIYEMKNDYESKLYWCKNKLDELKEFATMQEVKQIENHIKTGNSWVEEEHSKKLNGSEKDIENYQNKLKQINYLKSVCEELAKRKQQIDHLKTLYDRLSESICIALENNLDQQSREKVLEVMTWGQEAYQKMENSNWISNELTSTNLQQAITLVQNAKPK